MYHRIAGTLLITIGFATPFVLKQIIPAFLSAAFISLLCFWIGFIAIMTPVGINDRFKPYLAWARFAVYVNIGLNFLAVAYFYTFFYFDLQNTIGNLLMRFLGFVHNPIQWASSLLIPEPMIQQPDGSVLVTTSFIRSLLNSFFNIMFFCFLGILSKLIKLKITIASTKDAQGERPARL